MESASSHFICPSTTSADDWMFGRFATNSHGDETLPKINDYDPIASVFDEIMAFDFHDATAAIRWTVINSIRRAEPLRCLDLCCGTGLFFSLLSNRRRIDASGIDLSRGQLAVASSRGVANSSCVTYQLGDVVDSVFPARQHLISINFDALNHIEGTAAWLSIFERAYQSLNKGGVLLFDVNLPERLVIDWNSPEVISKPNVSYIQIAYPVERRSTGVVRLTDMITFQRDEDGRFTRKVARVRQFAISVPEILTLLSQVGFESVDLISQTNGVPAGHLFNKNRVFIRADK